MITDRPETGFLGAPIETDTALVDARFALLGVPFGWSYPDPGTTAGCADAPAAIRRRSARLSSFVGHWDFDADAPMATPSLVDAGDVPGQSADGAANHARTTEAVRGLLDRGAIPVCLGGDDSVPIPILRAFAGRGPLVILQVDAHLDFRDEVDGVREGYSSPMRRASEMDHVGRIIQVGLRGVGSARPSDVEDSGRRAICSSPRGSSASAESRGCSGRSRPTPPSSSASTATGSTHRSCRRYRR